MYAISFLVYFGYVYNDAHRQRFVVYLIYVRVLRLHFTLRTYDNCLLRPKNILPSFYYGLLRCYTKKVHIYEHETQTKCLSNYGAHIVIITCCTVHMFVCADTNEWDTNAQWYWLCIFIHSAGPWTRQPFTQINPR